MHSIERLYEFYPIAPRKSSTNFEQVFEPGGGSR